MNPRPCVNCGYEVDDRYCGRCGQRAHEGRFSLGPVLRQAADDALNLDSGLLHTVVALSTRPGRMAREYVAGRTRPYTSPAKYLVIGAALATLASIYSGFAQMQAAQVAAGGAREVDERVARYVEFFQTYFNAVLIVGVPLFPILSRRLFRRSGYNFTEHLIFNTYVYAHQNLVFTAMMPLFLVLGDGLQFSYIYFASITLYYVWACRDFFGVSSAAAAARGIAVLVLFTIAYTVGLALLLTVVLAVAVP